MRRASSPQLKAVKSLRSALRRKNVQAGQEVRTVIQWLIDGMLDPDPTKLAVNIAAVRKNCNSASISLLLDLLVERIVKNDSLAADALVAFRIAAMPALERAFFKAPDPLLHQKLANVVLRLVPILSVEKCRQIRHTMLFWLTNAAGPLAQHEVALAITALRQRLE